MSQSPEKFEKLVPNDSYLKNFDALGAMIARGRSFSGRERHCCFVNTGDGRFSDVSAATGFDLIDDGRAVALVDWDGDGDQDLWITNRTAPRLRLLRNDFPSSHHYLTVKLQGRTCNRDAIGARVEVHLNDEGAGKIIRTLRAGDGFLSQSSKWLTLGLGNAASIERVVVRWPGSAEAETFGGVQPDCRYTLVQGSGEVVAQDFTARQLTPSPPIIPPPTNRVRLVLAYRKPLPEIEYTDFQGQRQRLEKGSKRGKLINLWASWCAPCLEELHGWITKKQELGELGLEVVALSTDDLTGNPAGDAAKAEEFLAQSGWPFAAGVATEPLVRALTELHHEVVYRERPLALPTSFLVDSQNRVSVIYQGPVSVEQLVKDVELLEAPPKRIAADAFPFPGKIASHLFPRDAFSLALSFLEGGYLEDAYLQLNKFITEQPTDTANGDASDRGSALAKLSDAYLLLGKLEQQRGHPDEAIAAFREVVFRQPQQPVPRISLALALWSRKDRRGALEQLDAVERLGDQDAQILNLLGHTYTELGESERAVQYYRRALERQPDSYMVRFNLAVACQTVGNAKEAIKHYQEVIQQEPKAVNAANNLAWILATFDDEQIRDPSTALRLANGVRKATGGRDPSVLDTLAAALAASGRYEEAVRVAQRAVDLARQQNQSELADKIHSRLQQYQQSKPYLESQAK